MTQSRQVDAKQGKRFVGTPRLAGILLILLVHEGLDAHDNVGSSNDQSEPLILGVTMQDIFQLLVKTVKQAGLTRDELLMVVMDEDTEGSATELAQSRELAAAIFAEDELMPWPGTRPSLRWRASSKPR